MSSRSSEGNVKGWLLPVRPADWDEPEGEKTLNDVELAAGIRILRLVSDGGITINPTANTASQALLDKGKVSHNAGTRERTGELRIEADFDDETALAGDDMYDLVVYGDKYWLVQSRGGVPEDGHLLQVYELEMGDGPQLQPSARDTKQNFHVPIAIQEWDEKVVFVEEP
ncbi:hypothetical protein [Phytoactinopolyspora limicola]|uniref:phage tail tube protein n=1 Tax=Phytoactinopolyspora limicola TaxID=2715536 RepID=UPI00140B1F63|nr:hypothetical protein [Phytoactinopolyspora limicola]